MTTCHRDTAKLPSLPVERLLESRARIASGVPEGLDALLLGELARHAARPTAPVHPAYRARRPTACHARRRAALLRARRARAGFPAWDGVPYDRVAPNAETIARRIATLAELTGRAAERCASR